MALTYSYISATDSYSVVSNSCTAGAVVIPSTHNNGINGTKPVTSIGSNAFYGCATITSVTIPNSVTSIGDSAFLLCINLTSITIGNNVTSIGDSAFYNCANLESVTFTPTSRVESIASSAFSRCYDLASITIPNTVTTIGNQVFYICNSLTRVNFLGNAPTLGTNVFLNTNVNLKIYRQNLTAGWTSTFGGKPVFILRSNIIKGGGTGKLTTWNRSVDRDALKYIQLIESLTSPNNPITQDSKNKINSFIKQIKQIVPWNNFTAWTFIRGQNAFPFLNSTNNKYNGIVKTFGGLGGGEVISANRSTSNGDEGVFFSSPGGLLAISPSSFFTSVKSIFGVFKPTDNFYYTSLINQSIFGVYGGSGPTSYIYSNLYYRSNAVYSRITRNSIDNIQTNHIDVFNLNFYKSLGTIFDANSTSNYSNGIKQFTASPLSVPNASLFAGVSIGGGIVNGGTIPFVFVSDLVLTDAQMLAIHNIYKSTLGANLTNSQL